MKATSSGNLDLVYYLVANGADIFATDIAGNTAFSIAQSNGYNNIAQYLKKEGHRQTELKRKQAEKIAQAPEAAQSAKTTKTTKTTKKDSK